MDKKEIEYLDVVLKFLKKKLVDVNIDLEAENEKLYDMREYIWKNKDDMDSKEMLNELRELELEQHIAMLDYHKNVLLKRMENNPYFARIDFNGDMIYIGLASLLDEKMNSYIYDWRAPISSLYYDYELGEASYVSPEGLVDGVITKKRQYVIENGKLVSMFDNSQNIQDDLLKKVLSENKTDKMKDIVNTIQKEQNAVIRNVTNGVLIVEGPAGSGKTSVALHRIAYLLYKYRESLKASEVLIFSPNKVFTEYISRVLPDLGEQNAQSTLFSDYMYKSVSEYNNIGTYMEFIESIYENKNNFELEIIKTKINDKYILVIDKYIDYIRGQAAFKDIIIDDRIVITKNEVIETYNKNKNISHFDRLDNVVDYAAMKYRHNTFLNKKHPATVRKLIKSQLDYNNNFKNIYIDMYDNEVFKKELNDKFPNLDIELFCQTCKSKIKGLDISYLDSIIFIYIKGFLEGFNKSTYIKQVVLDEAQDYIKMQYIILKNIFIKAKFTILGDCNQILNPLLIQDNLNNIGEVFDRAGYLGLNTTYRNSYEITKFCNKILGLNNVNPIERYTSSPIVIENVKKEDLFNELKEVINENCYKSFAIITKSRKEADKINKILDEHNIEYTTYDSKRIIKSSLTVLPVYYAKGLEFDNVIVYDDMDNNFKDKEKKMFYVACTRALHKLTIISQSKLKI